MMNGDCEEMIVMDPRAKRKVPQVRITTKFVRKERKKHMNQLQMSRKSCSKVCQAGIQKKQEVKKKRINIIHQGIESFFSLSSRKKYKI